MVKKPYLAPDLQRATTPGAWPRISLVTAVRNGAKYLEATIQSVLQQNYPNLEYIVIDGASTDGTLDIIRKYERHITFWMSETDSGLFDGLNKGFAKSTGEIMGWLNASDMLQLNGLIVVGSVLGAFPEVEWITGRPTKFGPTGMTVNVWPPPHWSRVRFLAGANRYIQQESTYWRRSLWQKAGGALSTKYRAEGDFELWARFFRYAQLYTVDALIGGYRSHDDALSLQDLRQHNINCDEIAARELDIASQHSRIASPGYGLTSRHPQGPFSSAHLSAPRVAAIKLFRFLDRHIRTVPKIRGLWRHLAIQGLYKLPGPDWPPVIVEDTKGWVARRG